MYKHPNLVHGPKNVVIPPSLNFGEYILDTLWKHKDKSLINAATGEQVSYGQILQHAMNLSISLGHIGLRKGQVVAICSDNRNEFIPAVMGVIFTGAVVTTINTGYTKSELTHVMNISKPKYVICSPESYKNIEKTLKTLSFVKTVIVFGETRYSNVILYNDLVIPGRDFKVKGKALKEDVKYEEFEAVSVQGQTDTVIILYSSGTTGLPKGVMLTHLNLVATCCTPPSPVPVKYMLAIAPWYHVMGLIGTLYPMLVGRTILYLPKFQVDMYLRAIEKYRVTQLTVVPPVLVALTKSDLTKYDLSSVEIITSGAAPLHKDTMEALKLKLPTAKAILQGYGMTEGTLAVCRGVYQPGQLPRMGSVGHVTPCTVVKIADLETGRPLGPNQEGEVRFKGPLLMKGYIGKDLKEDLDAEGFFKTGDIGYYDEDRVFYIVDRLKELIKYKGYQVPPAEIEAVLLQHPGVKDAGVVGVADSAAGEVPLAFVVRQPDSEVAEGEIRQFIAERLSNPKHLRGGVRFVDSIPKTTSGKILRRTLKAIAGAGKSKL